MMIAPSVFTRRDPNAIEFLSRLRPPSLAHPFGTDENGRDLWARVVYGARPTLAAAGSLIVVAAALGSIIGLLIGAAGRAADEWLMRVTELFLAFPQIVWALAFATVMGRGLVSCVVALAITWWAQTPGAHARSGARLPGEGVHPDRARLGHDSGAFCSSTCCRTACRRCW
jgi:peptide/nickel transport system permease protein